ncbi:unnamed protein product [Tilletia controversa]|nr:unnamed protein product [Tilletia controversa]
MSNGTFSDSAAYGRTMPPALRIDASSSSSGSGGKNGSKQQPRADAAPLAIDLTALDTDSTKTLDPLEYYHRHMLDTHPGMDSSVASDDDFLDLLRNTKDRDALKWIEECSPPLSAQLVPVNYPPWNLHTSQTPSPM